MNLFERAGIDMDWILLGLCVAVLLLLILQIISMIKARKLNRKYLNFMKGANGQSLEASILKKIDEVERNKSELKELKKISRETTEVLTGAYQKIGIVKYDAFNEMGGKLSFSLCILNERNDGVILTSMHSSREGCYTYVKEIIKGESFVLLSQEEKQALEDAKNKTNYYV